MRLTGAAMLACALLIGLSRPAAAQYNATQYTVTSADVQRLQDSIYDASREVAQVRGRDAAYASQLQAELDEAREDAIYLKVKLRRNEPISRSDYADVRNAIENIRARARGDSTGGYTPPVPVGTNDRGINDRGINDRGINDRGINDRGINDRGIYDRPTGTVGRNARPNEVPVGTEFDVRLQNSLSSGSSQVEDRFQATTLVDLMQGERVLVPAGSVMRGVVSTVIKAGHIERKGSMTVVFDQVTVHGRSYPIRATVEQVLESEGIRGEATKIGAGAGVGAIIGAILGGTKGALAGILIGGGGVIAGTEGTDVDLPAGTVLRVRLDSALTVR